ncbi:hypothetical protein BCR33DRAFT_712541 [Rhizoclosmatium globosum]|uniref:Uncharacterized protein n=1 Tax=Rhizoclosmatium globosum TaxID=329046 RepID=A0A1Y2CWZ3_9FUNG|nr:hypothetical protein BCR33DRAFT_712541 [Rhizoclosmatium globosum]|eukprot:ORY51497.1 hypothetical protein BCR33DRAFT_712541 [Rhizoclosmatium globosum]
MNLKEAELMSKIIKKDINLTKSIIRLNWDIKLKEAEVILFAAVSKKLKLLETQYKSKIKEMKKQLSMKLREEVRFVLESWRAKTESTVRQLQSKQTEEFQIKSCVLTTALQSFQSQNEEYQRLRYLSARLYLKLKDRGIPGLPLSSAQADTDRTQLVNDVNKLRSLIAECDEEIRVLNQKLFKMEEEVDVSGEGRQRSIIGIVTDSEDKTKTKYVKFTAEDLESEPSFIADHVDREYVREKLVEQYEAYFKQETSGLEDDLEYTKKQKSRITKEWDAKFKSAEALHDPHKRSRVIKRQARLLTFVNNMITFQMKQNAVHKDAFCRLCGESIIDIIIREREEHKAKLKPVLSQLFEFFRQKRKAKRLEAQEQARREKVMLLEMEAAAAQEKAEMERIEIQSMEVRKKGTLGSGLHSLGDPAAPKPYSILTPVANLLIPNIITTVTKSRTRLAPTPSAAKSRLNIFIPAEPIIDDAGVLNRSKTLSTQSDKQAHLAGIILGQNYLSFESSIVVDNRDSNILQQSPKLPSLTNGSYSHLPLNIENTFQATLTQTESGLGSDSVAQIIVNNVETAFESAEKPNLEPVKPQPRSRQRSFQNILSVANTASTNMLSSRQLSMNEAPMNDYPNSRNISVNSSAMSTNFLSFGIPPLKSQSNIFSGQHSRSTSIVMPEDIINLGWKTKESPRLDVYQNPSVSRRCSFQTMMETQHEEGHVQLLPMLSENAPNIEFPDFDPNSFFSFESTNFNDVNPYNDPALYYQLLQRSRYKKSVVKGLAGVDIKKPQHLPALDLSVKGRVKTFEEHPIYIRTSYLKVDSDYDFSTEDLPQPQSPNVANQLNTEKNEVESDRSGADMKQFSTNVRPWSVNSSTQIKDPLSPPEVHGFSVFPFNKLGSGMMHKFTPKAKESVKWEGPLKARQHSPKSSPPQCVTGRQMYVKEMINK